MTSDLSRRNFMGTAVATTAFAIVPRHVLGGPGAVPPSEKVTMANIGMGTQGFRELPGLLENPAIQVVAVCDPNRDSNDYVEWGKNGIRNLIRRLTGEPDWRAGVAGCPGGREVGRHVVDAYYRRTGRSAKPCRAYADFRDLLENEKDLDAVKVMTPDHLHAAVSIAAMKRGKHVVMHKPIANRLHEGRCVIDTARQTGVATHLLAYGSGTENGLIAQAIKQGVIGKLREIHNWTNRPVWPQYTQLPTDKPPVPEGLDWQLWLGPAVDRPFHPHYTHTVFRGWYDFGGGSMADMGIYSLWPILTALDLAAPTAAQAWATHACTIDNNVSRTIQNDFSYPTGCTIRLTFAATEAMPELDLFWYDGGMKPRLPRALEDRDVEMAREGILYIGDDGAIMAGFRGNSPQLFARGKQSPLWQTVTKPPAGGRGRGTATWLEAFQGKGASPGSFLNAASITDAVNLGTVALRHGKKVLFDSQQMTITNARSANKYLRRAYRTGWEI